MPTIKYPISLNDEDQRVIKNIGKSLNIDTDKTYGATSKIIKLSIRLAEKTADSISKSIPTVEPAILDFLLSAIRIKKIQEYHKKKAEKGK